MRLPVPNRRKVGVKARPHGPYGQGLTRHTKGGTEGCTAATWNESQKADRSPDLSRQIDAVKSEALLIVDQHATGNTFPGLVHAARHTMGVDFTGNR